MYMELTEAPEPKVIMTDRAPAILSAVHSELPNTIHLCCQFHLYGNLKQQSLKFHLDPLAVENDFKRVVFAPTDRVLISRMEALQGSYPALKQYLHGFMEVRRLWAQCWRTDIFCADANTTQAIESLNHAIKANGALNKANLGQLIQHLDKYSKEGLTVRAQKHAHKELGVAVKTTQFPRFQPLFSHMREFSTTFAIQCLVDELAKLYNFKCRTMCMEELLTFLRTREAELQEEDTLPDRLTNCFTEEISDWLFFMINNRDSPNIHDLVAFHPNTGKLVCSCDTPKHGGLPCAHFLVAMLECNDVFFHPYLVHPRYWKCPDDHEYVQLTRVAKGKHALVTLQYSTVYRQTACITWQAIRPDVSEPPQSTVATATVHAKKLKDMAKKLKQLPYEQLGIIDEAIEDAYDSIRPTSISTSAAIIPSDLTIASTKEKSKRAASSSSPPVTQRQRKPYKLSQQARGDLPVQLKQQAAKRRAVEYEDNDNEQDARETSTLVLPTPSELTSDPGSSTMSTSSARRRNPVVKLNL